MFTVVVKQQYNTIRTEKRVPNQTMVKNLTKLSKSESTASAGLVHITDDDVDIKKLRKNKCLKKSVMKQLKELALDNSPSENSDNSPFPVASHSGAESGLISNLSSVKKEKRKAVTQSFQGCAVTQSYQG